MQRDGSNTVLMVGETIDGVLSNGSRDLGKQARQLAGMFGGQPVGVLTGYQCEPAANKWSQAAGMPVIVLDDAQARYPHPPLTASGVEELAGEVSPLAVCFPHNLRACQAAATLAWRLRAPCVSAVESIARKNGHLSLERSIFGGKLCETMSTAHRPIILTVMPGLFSQAAPAAPPVSPPAVQTRQFPDMDHRFTPRSIDQSANTDQALKNAQVVVAGGRGLGGAEHAALMDSVAGLFKSAAVGGSRGACDLGWLPHSRQIGETGQTVSPALYLACGISGAPQHLAGMRESGTIVAVNTDPKAAILNAAHVAVIEDVKHFLPVLRERYEKMTSKGKRL